MRRRARKRVAGMGDVIRIKLVRSPIGTTQRIRETLRGLGLTRMGRERELTRTPMVDGMLRRVAHLVAEIKPGEVKPGNRKAGQAANTPSGHILSA